MLMQMHLYNTLTRSTDPFEPLDPPRVSMYSCGPTVYDYAHIGNFRSFLSADLLRRTLELLGHDVHHVMNITDVGHMTEDATADASGEDKMLVAASRLKEAKKAGTLPEGVDLDPSDPFQIAAYYTDAFIEDAQLLRIKVASDPDNMPRATEHIPEMLDMIDTLIAKGHAYTAPDKVVYFHVPSFSDYGKLSGNTLDKLKEGMGGRISEHDQANKKHPADFMLWKPDEHHIMKWPSKHGDGYPGWHIECSTLARTLLQRDVIDIHTGGEDLVFPHHECEIAQSRGATGEDTFARFFVHTRFLLVDGEKMSKSKGTFYTARDVIEGRATGRQTDAGVLRHALLRGHYRANLNFTPEGVAQAAAEVTKLRRLQTELEEQLAGETHSTVGLDHPAVNGFAAALADDLNISEAMAAVFSWEKQARSQEPAEALAVLRTIDSVLGVLETSPHHTEQPSGFDPVALCTELDQARANKDFDRADAIRAELTEQGYLVKTTAQGTVAEKTLG